MTKTNTYFDLRSACSQPGCPVCRIEQSAVRHFLDALLYEQVNDPKVRDHLRASFGFCQEHAWMAADDLRGNALGLAIIYDDILGAALDQLGAPPAGRGRSSVPHRPCPACEQRKTTGHRTISVLAEHASDSDLTSALRSSDGLCLPHLRLALNEVRDAAARESLLALHRERFARLRAELAEFIRKNDYRFMHEKTGAEGDSWRRAIGVVAGSKFVDR